MNLNEFRGHMLSLHQICQFEIEFNSHSFCSEKDIAARSTAWGVVEVDGHFDDSEIHRKLITTITKKL